MSLSGPVRARIVVNLQIIGVLIFRGSSGLCFCFCFVLFLLKTIKARTRKIF